MATHIALMCAVAPALALAWQAAVGGRSVSAPELAVATCVQIAALWAAHAPPVMAAAAHVPAGSLFMQTLLLIAALWFWLAVLATPRAQYWRSLLALVVTGKLFCMLGLLLIFAPHAFYPELAVAHSGSALAPAAALSDQRLAGFLMIAACPAFYMLAALALAALWLKAMTAAEPITPARA